MICVCTPSAFTLARRLQSLSSAHNSAEDEDDSDQEDDVADIKAYYFKYNTQAKLQIVSCVKMFAKTLSTKLHFVLEET